MALDKGELEGLTELGSRKQALARAKEFLNTTPLTDEEFREALRAILTHGFTGRGGKYRFNAARWAPPVQHAYSAMLANQQRRLRPTMLWFFSQWDREKAGEFLDTRYLDPGDLATALRVAVASEQPRVRVEQLATQAEESLRLCTDDFERDDLHAALAQYHINRDAIDAALAHTRAIRHLDVFAEQALQWPVELQIASALAAARERRAAIEEYRRRPPTAMDLALPQYRETELNKAAKKLAAYERKLRAIAPIDLSRSSVVERERSA